MAFWTWLITLLKGFIPADGKRIGKIIWVLVLCACAIGVYHRVFIAKTAVTRIERIDTQIINQCPPEENKAFGVGFNIWKFKVRLGI